MKGISKFSEQFSTEELERLLSRALVPIEPNEVFVNRLRGSLVKVHGKKPLNIWTGLALLASFLLLLAMSFGVMLRFLLTGIGLINLLSRRQSLRNAAGNSGGAIPVLASNRNV